MRDFNSSKDGNFKSGIRSKPRQIKYLPDSLRVFWISSVFPHLRITNTHICLNVTFYHTSMYTEQKKKKSILLIHTLISIKKIVNSLSLIFIISTKKKILLFSLNEEKMKKKKDAIAKIIEINRLMITIRILDVMRRTNII